MRTETTVVYVVKRGCCYAVTPALALSTKSAQTYARFPEAPGLARTVQRVSDMQFCLCCGQVLDIDMDSISPKL